MSHLVGRRVGATTRRTWLVWALGTSACVGGRLEDEAAGVVAPIVLDNDGAGFAMDRGSLDWARSKALKGAHGGDHREAPGGRVPDGRFSKQAGKATWKAPIAVGGRYFVQAWFPPDPGNTPRAEFGMYLWASRPGAESPEIVWHRDFHVDQRTLGADDGWTLLSDVQVEKGDTVEVSVHPYVSERGRVVADAVRLTRATRPLEIAEADPCASPWVSGAVCMDQPADDLAPLPEAPVDCSMVACEWCDGLDTTGPCCSDDREDPETCPTW